MSSSKSILSTIAQMVVKALTSRTSRSPQKEPGRPAASDDAGALAGIQTIQIDPDRIGRLTISYAPVRDGRPDAGEVIWTWVPYEENDGRGKDRPVLVIARQSSERAYAVRMTSKANERDRDYLSIGSGSWDSQGRESWVDVDQLYSVHEDGMRREAAVLDRRRFARVAAALGQRYGWKSTA